MINDKIRYRNNRFIDINKSFLFAKTKEFIKSSGILFIVAFILFIFFNILILLNIPINADNNFSLGHLVLLYALIMFPALPYFAYNLFSILASAFKIISSFFIKYQFVYTKKLNEVDDPINNMKKKLEMYAYEITDNSINLYFLHKTKEETTYAFKDKLTIDINNIHEDDFEDFIYFIDQNKVDLLHNFRDEIIQASAAKESAEKEKVNKRGKLKKLGYMLAEPYYITYAFIAITIIMTLQIPLAIVLFAFNSLISIIGPLFVGAGAFIGIVIIPLSILIAIIFVIKYIWMSI